MTYRINLAADGFSADKTAAALDEIADELENPTNLAASAPFASQYVPLPAAVGTVGQVLAISSLSPLVTEWVTASTAPPTTVTLTANGNVLTANGNVLTTTN